MQGCPGARYSSFQEAVNRLRIIFVVQIQKIRIRCPDPESRQNIDENYARRLLTLATSENGTYAKYAVRGNHVAIVEFADAWQTGYVSMDGLPSHFVGTIDDARRYCVLLYDMLKRGYATIGITIPSWRSWDSFVEKWPFLTVPKRRVHLIRPL